MASLIVNFEVATLIRKILVYRLHFGYITATTYCITGMIVSVFANGLGDQGSIPGRLMPKLKNDTSYLLHNTQHYKVQIKEANQEKEKHSLVHLGIVAIEKGSFQIPPTTVGQLIYIYIYIYIYIILETGVSSILFEYPI